MRMRIRGVPTTPTGVIRTTQEATPVGRSVKSRFPARNKLPDHEWRIAEAEKLLVKEFDKPSDTPFTTRIRGVRARNMDLMEHMRVDWLSDVAERLAEKGLIKEEHLGKTKQGGSRRRVPDDERAMIRENVERAAKDPNNRFEVSLIAKAAGVSTNVLRKGWGQEIAPLGWDKYLRSVMYSHLWDTRDLHGNDPKKMSDITHQKPRRMEDAREALIAAEELSNFSGRHGKSLPAKEILERWEEFGGVARSLQSLSGDSTKLKYLRGHGVIGG